MSIQNTFRGQGDTSHLGSGRGNGSPISSDDASGQLLASLARGLRAAFPAEPEMQLPDSLTALIQQLGAMEAGAR